MQKKISWFTAVTLMFILAACGGNGEEVADITAVTGTITYLQHVALPDDAVVNMTIQNASLADAPPETAVVSTTTIESPGQVPIPFSIPINPADVNENLSYLLYARIEDSAGNLLFFNPEGTPVLTHGSPSQNVEVMVQMIAAMPGTVEPTAVPPSIGTVTGNVVFGEAVTIPEGATANIMMQNASLADAPPEVAVVGQQIINDPRHFPIPFAVTFDANNIQENLNYVLFARIEDANGTLLFLNTQGKDVITQGNPSENVEVAVEKITPITEPDTAVEPTTPPPAPLPENTAVNPNSPTAAANGLSFRLIAFGPPGFEREIIPGTEMTAVFTTSQISGFAGCNEYQASLVPIADYFVFGAINTTRRECSEPAGIMKQEQDYLSSLQGTAGYQYRYQSDGSGTIIGLQLYYPLATGGNGALTYITDQ